MYFILDLDHTVAMSGERNIYFMTKPRNYPAAEAGVIHDIVHEPTFVIARALIAAGYQCIVLTARGEGARQVSENWLKKVEIDYTEIYLRPADDYRPDYEVKKEIFHIIKEKYGMPLCAFDDREDVIKMFEMEDVNTFQVRIVKG